MVEAGHGTAVVPSYGLPASRNRRVVMTRPVKPVVTLDFHQIQQRGRKLPPEAEEFTASLQQYIARWAGAAGILSSRVRARALPYPHQITIQIP